MVDDRELIREYLQGLSELINAFPLETFAKILNVLRKARQEDSYIFIFGNGGSAATASHMTCDLDKTTKQPGKPRFKAISLNDNIPLLSAYANDEGYDNVFSEQIITLGRPGDIVIAISGSGNSPNVLKAIQTASNLNITTIGITGFSGGKLKDLVDICLIVPSDRMEMIEDMHMVVDHLMSITLRIQ